MSILESLGYMLLAVVIYGGLYVVLPLAALWAVIRVVKHALGWQQRF